MLSCYDDAPCDSKVVANYGSTCGTTVGAVMFFCSFIFLCMFLVSSLTQHQNILTRNVFFKQVRRENVETQPMNKLLSAICRLLEDFPGRNWPKLFTGHP